MEGELAFLSPPRPPRVSEGGDACCFGFGFGSPTWAPPLGTLIDSPTWAPPLGTLIDSPPSCVSDGRGGGNGRSGFCSPTWGSPLEALFNSASSPCVSERYVGGNGSGFSTPKQASPRETLLNLSSSSLSDSRRGGNGSSPRASKERDNSELLQEAEELLRAITERYDVCFLRLRDTTDELADLHRERVRLGAENLRLSLLLEGLEAAEQSKQASAVAPTPPPKAAQAEAARAPKSISIRSKGFLSKKQPQGGTTPQRLRVRASQAMEDAGEKEQEEEDGEEVEVEAFRQGAVKTELCNKWERGACPYYGRCRFAHGMEELRPVIRHPRYKTLPCQLFAAASGCPYGHRCHFRHSLPPTAEFC